jgi:hypothetical protein
MAKNDKDMLPQFFNVADVASRTRHLQTCFQRPTKCSHRKIFSRTQCYPVVRHLHPKADVNCDKMTERWPPVVSFDCFQDKDAKAFGENLYDGSKKCKIWQP